ncbi:MAG TPA: hypothetical protein VFB34_04475 [Chloroflexota bacterium]|nr:hypothetical protein [Chloroflexota bacterium]
MSENPKASEQKANPQERKPYETPAIVYRGRLEVHAVTSCNSTHTSGCSIPCS